MFIKQQISILEWRIVTNSALITGINYILQYIHTKSVILNSKNIHNMYFYCICDQINAAVVRKRHYLQKHLKNPKPRLFTLF